MYEVKQLSHELIFTIFFILGVARLIQGGRGIKMC